jgi:hypothetical protein
MDLRDRRGGRGADVTGDRRGTDVVGDPGPASTAKLSAVARLTGVKAASARMAGSSIPTPHGDDGESS